jgi:SSS family solute:Na+ symporter
MLRWLRDGPAQRTGEASRQRGGKVEREHKLIGYRFDTAFGLLLSKALPAGHGIQGFILAAILGAVVSSLAAMINAFSTIFSLDIYQKYLAPKASQKNIVFTGRICVGTIMVLGCLIAPMLGDPSISSSIFRLIQESQGYISPGLLAAFTFALITRRVPAIAGCGDPDSRAHSLWDDSAVRPDDRFPRSNGDLLCDPDGVDGGHNGDQTATGAG